MKATDLDCHNCGAKNPAGYTFCHHCRHEPKVAAARAPAPKKVAAKKKTAKK